MLTGWLSHRFERLPHAALLRVVLLICVLARPAAGEETPPPLPPPKPIHFDLDARVQPEHYDYFAPTGPYQNAYTFLGLRIRPGLRCDGDGWEAYLQGQGVFLYDLPRKGVAPSPAGALGQGGTYDNFTGSPGSATLGVRQLFVRLGPPSSRFQAGRFEYSQGLEVRSGDATLDWIKDNRISRLIVGGPDYNTFGRTFDGLRADLDSPSLHLTGLVAHPTQIEPHFATDVPNVTTGNLALTFKKGFVPGGEGQLFFNQTHDTRFVGQVDNRPAALRGSVNAEGGDRISTFGAYYVSRLGADGDAMALYARQSGSWGAQTQDAWAFVGELGVRFPKGPWQPWLRGGYRVFSGDPNPLDGRHQTFMAMVADARPRYNMYTNANLREAFLELMLAPTKKTSLRTDLRFFSLDRSADLWYSGIGVAQERGANGMSGRPSGGGTDVGTLIEVTWEDRIDAHNLLRLHLGKAFPGPVVRATYPGPSSDFMVDVEYHYLIP
jgi:hypothetical protein